MQFHDSYKILKNYVYLKNNAIFCVKIFLNTLLYYKLQILKLLYFQIWKWWSFSKWKIQLRIYHVVFHWSTVCIPGVPVLKVLIYIFEFQKKNGGKNYITEIF